jgi:N-acetylneuraminate synthase
MKLIIAGVGSTHGGSFDIACAQIDIAAHAGAGAIRFQAHVAAAEVSSQFKSAAREFERVSFTIEEWNFLKRRCEERGLIFVSSPCGDAAVEMMEKIGVDFYKIPSSEVSNLLLLERLAATKKSIILSSGMSDWSELDRAVEILRPCQRLVILQCSPFHPCPVEMVGLNVLLEMQARYGLDVGLSDHTAESTASIAAASGFGAVVVEKHITFSRLIGGYDQGCAMEAQEFKRLCVALRAVWAMLDSPIDKNNTTGFRDKKSAFEKSLYARRELIRYHALERDDLAAKLPHAEVSVSQYQDVIGLRPKFDLGPDTPIAWELFDDGNPDD